jgi:hypothetical protein
MKHVYIALLAALPLSTVAAQQPTAITLSCSGTSRYMMASDDAKPEPVTNIGMIVNFSDRTITFDSYRIPFERTDSTIVLFHGDHALSYAGIKLKPVTIDGSVDRVTGAASVTFTHEQVGSNSTWELMCKPATRLF